MSLPDVHHRDVERRAARGGLISALAQTGKGLIDAGASLFLARALSPGDFGLIEMVISVTGIIDLFKDLGLSSATVQRDRLEPAQLNLLFWINVAVGGLLTLLTAALAPLVALAYEKPALLELTLALSLSSLLGALSIQHQALLRRELQFGKLARIELSCSLLGSAGAVLAALAGLGVWALVLRALIRLASQALLSWLVCPFRPGYPRTAEVSELLRFGKHLSGFQLMNYLERNLDNVLIGRFAGPLQLGLYTRAYELMRLPLSQLNAPLGAVAVPALSRLLAAPERYRRAYLAVLRLLLLVTVSLTPIAIFAAPWLVPSVLGPQWSDSVPLFQWLSLGLLVKPLLNTTSWLFISQGRTRELWRWGYVGSSLALLSFLVGLPWGAIGVAISYTLFDLLLRAPLLIFWTGRTGPVSARDLLASLRPAWLCAGAIALTYWLLEQQLAHLTAGGRTALCAAAAALVGVGVATLAPASRTVIQEGVAMLRTLRSRR